MMHPTLNRRTLLGAGLGGAAALGFAAWGTPTDWGSDMVRRPRLVVVFLDGGADGLSLAPPLNDGRYVDLRGGAAITNARPVDADFGLHPAMKHLATFAETGQLRLAPAAASPTLSRSHFREADIIESGFVDPRGARTGWLNRAVGTLRSDQPVRAVSLEGVASLLTAGETAFGCFEPGGGLIDPVLGAHLTQLYTGDPQLKAAMETACALGEAARELKIDQPGSERPEAARGRAAGRLLAAEDGPSAAFIRIGGFDTHVAQGAEHGRLAERLTAFDEAMGAMREELGPAWGRTVVVVYTELGRTAALNGSGGTDHGSASAALVLGGALKAGGLLGDWPTLAESRLHEGRDLAPGVDLRSLFKGVLHEHWGLDRAVLERTVFPDSLKAPPLRGLVA